MNAHRVPGYCLLDVLQAQGPVVTYLAREERSGRTVSLETLSASLFPSRGRADRWIDTVRSLRKLQHPNLAQVFDTGRNGVFWVAREWVPGLSLAALLESDWQFEPAHVLEIAAAVADVLAYLHAGGRAHGAVCPANVVVGTEGEIRLGGLGGLVALDGDPRFLAPELALGAPHGKATDLYALGRLLEVLLERLPSLTAADGTPLSAGSRALAALCHALTAEDPAARPRSTPAVAETLRTVLRRVLPVPEPPQNEDEVLDFADVIAQFGLSMTTYRATPAGRGTGAAPVSRKRRAPAPGGGWLNRLQTARARLFGML